MNRISYSLLTILAATVLFTACQKDSEHLVDLSAVIADQSGSNAKVYINGNYGCWQQGDVVKVKSGSNGTNNYSLKVEGSGVAADKATIKDVVEGTPYTAGYPGGNVTSIGNGTLNIEVPSSQSYVEAAIYDTATTNEQRIVCPMAAYSADGTTLRFYNVAAMLAVTVTNSESSPLTLYSVEVESDKSPLSGTATVTVTADTAYIAGTTSTSNSVTLTFGTTVTLAGGANKTVYIPVLPIGSGEGEKSTLTVHVKATANADGTGSKYTFHGVSRQPLSIAQNQMGNVPISLNTSDSKTEVNDYFWGQGTEDCPYLITDTSDLFRLRDLSSHFHLGSYNDSKYNNKDIYYFQTADLDISDSTAWGSSGHFAIGSSTSPFMANYNGGNHSVTLGINVTASGSTGYGFGLFGYIGNASVGSTNIIQNVTIRGEVKGNNYIRNYGGLVGFIRGSTRIVNCVNYATVSNDNTGSNGGVAGGICGSVGWYNGSSLVSAGTVSFENCSNYGKVHIENNYDTWTSSQINGTGGICGSLSASTSCTFTDCNNYGMVKGNASYVGGILGYCKAAGTFTGTNVNHSVAIDSGKYVGGVVGYVSGSVSFSGIASNEGKVKGGQYCGGIIGYLSGSGSFSGTLNSSRDAVVSGSSYIGGVLGGISTTRPSFSGTMEIMVPL